MLHTRSSCARPLWGGGILKLRMRRIPVRIVTLAVALLGLLLSSSQPTRSKAPSWAQGEHPRLMATADEKPALIQKLTTPGTVSAAIWSAFLTTNRSNQTGAGAYHYADAAVLYWITGNNTYGQRAHDAVMNLLPTVTDGIQPSGAGFDTSFWWYRDFMLTYDFAYDRFTDQERDDILRFIGLQGSKCAAAGPSWGPGNINTLWAVCAYGSGMLLENENRVDQILNEDIFKTFDAQYKLSRPTNVSNIVISNTPGGPADYTAGVDYTTCNNATFGDRCIDWSPSGNEPGLGQHFYVSYTFTPRPDLWKIEGRRFLEHHLNYQWRDGYYAGGQHPYASVNNEMLPLMIEMVRRDTGVDYRRNQDLKRQIDMFLYERLPSNDVYSARYNTLNDTSTWGEPLPSTHPEQLNFRNNTRPFIAWATSAYAGDPEGYDQRYLWWWGQFYRNANGTVKPGSTGPDWREAWWFNDQLAGAYPVTTLPQPDWPKNRYFRGKEVVYSRTGDFTASDPNAALLSMVAGPHNYQNEHDQGDAGSFTFYSLNEDWAIDPGYQDGDGGGNLYDHNTVGIDGGGYNANGVYGDPWATPSYGGFSHFGSVALTGEGTAVKANLTRAWTLTATPYVQNHERYLMMVNGSQPSYLIVGDDIQKDASVHAYDWYLHTAPRNTISTAGNVATINGYRNNADLDIHSFGSGTPSMSQTGSMAGNMDWYGRGSHQRLKISIASVTNPYFLHLLIPTATGGRAPTVASSAVANGKVITVTWPDSTVDTILWRHGSGSISGGNVTTDAKLAIVRVAGGALAGLQLIDGRTLAYNGQTIVETLDGTRPISVSALGPTVGVIGDDTARISVRLPNAASASVEDGQAVPATRIGDTLYLNAGQPFRTLRQGGAMLLNENFDDAYADDAYLVNTGNNPVEQMTPASGAQELKANAYDWPSWSRRDSTPWRRSGLYPTVVPTHEFGDAVVSVKFKFDSVVSGRKFRFFARVQDRDARDWYTNQDYLRLEFDPAAGTVTLGQRVNGSWTGIADNNNLTATSGTAAANLNDTNWHTLEVRMLGDAIRVGLDSATLFDLNLPTAIPVAPASGYLQWQVLGSSPVFIDDLLVRSIDLTEPAAPTGGTLTIDPSGQGSMTLDYGQGESADSARITLFEGVAPIAPTDDPSGLTTIATSDNRTALTFTGADRTKFHAVGVVDQAGNRSALLPLSNDVTAPSAVTDLLAN